MTSAASIRQRMATDLSRRWTLQVAGAAVAADAFSAVGGTVTFFRIPR